MYMLQMSSVKRQLNMDAVDTVRNGLETPSKLRRRTTSVDGTPVCSTLRNNPVAYLGMLII